MEKPIMNKPSDLPTTEVTETDKEIWKHEVYIYVKHKHKVEEISGDSSP